MTDFLSALLLKFMLICM